MMRQGTRGEEEDEKTGKGFWDREDKMRSAPVKRGEQKGRGSSSEPGGGAKGGEPGLGSSGNSCLVALLPCSAGSRISCCRGTGCDGVDEDISGLAVVGLRGSRAGPGKGFLFAACLAKLNGVFKVRLTQAVWSFLH